MNDSKKFRLLVVCPHFEPDTAPTGAVMTRIVSELASLGNEVHVVTSLPWYREHRVESEWSHVSWSKRSSPTAWGSIVRLNPFAGSDKRNILRRALGFIGFTVTSTIAALSVTRRHDVDAIVVMSPPLTLGVGAKVVALIRRIPMILNVQDVFPDAAIRTGVITNGLVIRLARAFERWTYRVSSAVTVLSDDLRDNVSGKLPRRSRGRVEVIPNFVDVEAITPCARSTRYRAELGLGDGPVVMYAGNVGFSQSLGLIVEAARALPQATFVINGSGSARADLEAMAVGQANVVFGDFQPAERLAEVLGTADLHVVPLHAGLGSVSVPSKTYSILAAGRPILASIDPDTEVPRILQASGAGVAVPPDDPEAFIDGIRKLLADPERLESMGLRGREFVENGVSPRSVAERYVDLIRRVVG
jgi:colanic acid biosynthesis glycosyl transferase WcaI